jgi:cell division protein ZapA (FtsZ GTPase activity inhibitor)
MAELNRVEVEILGQRYTIRSAAEAGYVRELAAYLEKRVSEIRGSSGGQDAARLLALAALYITDELFRLRDEHSEADRVAGAKLGALRELLDAIVTET